MRDLESSTEFRNATGRRGVRASARGGQVEVTHRTAPGLLHGFLNTAEIEPASEALDLFAGTLTRLAP